MSCQNEYEGPFNLKHTDSTCSEKCKLTYNFSSTAVTAYIREDYIEVKFTSEPASQAKYTNSSTLNCNSDEQEKNLSLGEIRIYQPSLHAYGTDSNGEPIRANAEFIMVMNNITGGRNALICIPVSTTQGMLPKATEQLNAIINYVSSVGGNEGDGGQMGNGFSLNLNDFISRGKSFYSYTANSPWDETICCLDYIVYDKQDVTMYISNSLMSTLATLISRSNAPVHELTTTIMTNIGYARNPHGAQFLANNDNNIWIDCRRTGENGEILENISRLNNNNPYGMFTGINQDTYEKYKWIFIVIGIVVGLILLLIFCVYILPNKITNLFSRGGPARTNIKPKS
tara:strand:- start:9745 stop:10770 length:1026 start_codon:yes stop_codon:yes gene_type:complete